MSLARHNIHKNNVFFSGNDQTLILQALVVQEESVYTVDTDNAYNTGVTNSVPHERKSVSCKLDNTQTNNQCPRVCQAYSKKLQFC